MIPNSNIWAVDLDQIGFDYADGACGYDTAIERLMNECDFSMTEAVMHLACFSPPKDEP